MRSSYTAICNLCSLLIFYLLRQITQVMMFGSGDIFMPVFKHHNNSSAIKVQLLKPVVGYQNRLINADKEMSCLILQCNKAFLVCATPCKSFVLFSTQALSNELQALWIFFPNSIFFLCSNSFRIKHRVFIQQNKNLERCCLLTCSKRTCKGTRLTE